MDTINQQQDTSVASLEAKILDEVRKTNRKHTVHFYYTEPFKVKVATFNPLLNEMFTLASITSEISIVDALENVLRYVVTHRDCYNSYTVIWSKKISDVIESNSSVFYCKNVKEVIDKFFDGKDEDSYIIYEIKMSPLS